MFGFAASVTHGILRSFGRVAFKLKIEHLELGSERFD